jgi:hypothetical protein
MPVEVEFRVAFGVNDPGEVSDYSNDINKQKSL